MRVNNLFKDPKHWMPVDPPDAWETLQQCFLDGTTKYCISRVPDKYYRSRIARFIRRFVGTKSRRIYLQGRGGKTRWFYTPETALPVLVPAEKARIEEQAQ